jgi:hypothetical protein
MNIQVLGSNQTQIDTERYTVFFSYNTPVAYYDKINGGYYKTSHKWSVTTSKHINRWLESVKAESVDQTVLDNLL